MKLLLESTDRAMLLEKAALLHSQGVPVHLEEVPHVGAVPSHLYVMFDRQYDDAMALLQDATHTVAQPVYDDELEGIAAEVREYKLAMGNDILQQLTIGVLALMSVVYVASRVFD